MPSKRLVGGIVTQGIDEYVSYKFDFTRLVDEFGTPTGIASCSLFDLSLENLDVSATKLTGTATLSGTIATTRIAFGLLAEHRYQLNVAVQFPDSIVLSSFLLIKGEL